MKKKSMLKSIITFMLGIAMVTGAALLPGSVLSVRAETTQLPAAENGTIRLMEGVRLSSNWNVNENVTIDTNNLGLIMVNNEITISSGVTLTVNGTISVESGNTLTVNGSGTLIVTGANGGYVAGYCVTALFLTPAPLSLMAPTSPPPEATAATEEKAKTAATAATEEKAKTEATAAKALPAMSP